MITAARTGLARNMHADVALIGDKGYSGHELASQLSDLDVAIV